MALPEETSPGGGRSAASGGARGASPARRRGGRRRRRSEVGRGGAGLRKLSLVLLFCVAQGLFLFSPILRVHEVEVLGVQRIPEGVVMAQVGVPVGSYLWELPYPDMVERLKSLKEVHSARVGVSLPGRVTFRVHERVPVFQVAASDHPGDWWELDVEGVVLGRAGASSTLPRLIVQERVAGQERLDPAPGLVMLRARAWLEPVLPPGPSIYEVDPLQSVSVQTRFLGVSTLVRAGPLQGIDYKGKVLRALMERLTREGRPVSVIDLRFSSPVVTPVESRVQGSRTGTSSGGPPSVR